MPACAACGASNPERFRFCGECGAALHEATSAPATQVRKVVTVLFVDVTGSTELGERLDPEAMRRAMGRYFAAAREVIERHGGTVEKFVGDAVMAVFGIPRVHEDDAIRAVRAAAEVRDRLTVVNDALKADLGVELSVRIGLNTGEVVAGADEPSQTLVTGDTVNTAARLEQSAATGEILIGETTNRLVRGLARTEALEAMALKGKGAPVAAYRLVEVAPPTAMAARQLEAPMVGRESELTQLATTLRRVIDERRCHLFTVVGAAGVGKSRLVREFIAGFGSTADVVRGRCLPYGDGITYWPIMEIVRQSAGIEPADTAAEARAKLDRLADRFPDGPRAMDRVSTAIGLSPDGTGTDEIAWGVQKLFAGLARDHPLVVIIDDIQWAEPAMLDLIEQAARWIEGAPLLILCMARPDLLDERPAWSGGFLNAQTVLLDPLPAEDSAALIESLLGADVLGDSLGQRIIESAEGNPLFVEEMIGMLIDGGILTRSDGSDWQVSADVDRVEVPPTIQALLAARLDGLPHDERRAAQRGSVIGRTFETDAVAELSPEAGRQQLITSLRGLVRHQVIGPYQEEDVYRFRHLLIRDAAYDALPKEERAELHERFADWVEAASGDRLLENEEIVGYHLEQAHDYRQRLGQRDDHVARLAARAGGFLATAGHRADLRRDVRAANVLLTRAVRLLPQNHPQYWSARLDLGNVLADAGDADGASETLGTVADGPTTGPGAVPQETRAEARLYRAWVDLDRMQTTGDEVMRTVCAVVRIARKGGYHRLRSRAWRMAAGLYMNRIEPLHATRAYQHAARYARLAGDDEAEIELLLGLAGLGSRSRMPIGEAVRLVDQALALPKLGQAQESKANETKAYLYAMLGRFDEARALIASSLRELEEKGRVEHITGVLTTAGLIELFAERYEAAAEKFEASREVADRAGMDGWTFFISARLAHVNMLRGRDADSEAEAERARPSPHDAWANMFIDGARARILARRGDTAEAVETARSMVAAAEAARFEEYPAIFATGLEDFAIVLAADGQHDDARGVLGRLIEMQRAKENVAGLAKAERLLASLDRSPDTAA